MAQVTFDNVLVTFKTMFAFDLKSNAKGIPITLVKSMSVVDSALLRVLLLLIHLVTIMLRFGT